MTQGISASLNSALARVNYIEYSFSALENIAGELPQANTKEINELENDFQKILNKTVEENKVFDIEKKEELIVKATEAPKPTENKEELTSKIEEITEIEDKKNVNLKPKITLKSNNHNIDEIIETFSKKYGIDSNFIRAIVKQESGFNPNATSKKGAMGLMQLMPKTAQSLGIRNAYNPWENIEGGVKYLKGLMDRYGNNKELALAAYNAGPTAVKKYGGIPPYKETQKYVTNIMDAYNKVKGASI